MLKSPRIILLAAAGLVGALILVAVIVLLILGVNAKLQVQTLLSDALEMEVKRRWPTRHRFLSETAHYDGECADPQSWL
jgi:hypothetical protein